MTVRTVAIHLEQVSLAEAVDAFLDERDLAVTSVRKYRATLEALAGDLGDIAVVEVTGRQLVEVLDRRWGGVAPATWNRNRATLRSFFAYCRRQRWVIDDPSDATERRRDPVDRTRAIPHVELERLWGRRDVALRERAMWRLLYETAARAGEILALDVDDVDLANRRAVITAKGGDREWVHFQTGSARLLANLTVGRKSGPVFLATKRPSPARAPATCDTDPVSGRARLSYRRAEELFVGHSGGRTLHQLRHSALTDLAEAGVPLPLLMAKSRHRDLKTLQRYARPGPQAVAALTAAHDPERRHRP